MGYDGSGKLQYLYHADYLEFRNQRKFSDLPRVGLALPRIRRRITLDLKSGEWDETRLLALLVRILDRYHLRVGSRVYATRNQTFGLTTLRRRHLKEEESELRFDYVAKGGQPMTVRLTDPELVSLVREVAEFPGWELFSIRQGSHKIVADPGKVNAYIREAAGCSELSARSFRTWAGTVLAVKLVDQARRHVARHPRRELPAVLTELVAARLGNTAAICRQYYIHPDVLTAVTAEDFDSRPRSNQHRARCYRQHERRALEILTGV
jgi:DNA topoisomerase-1